jgi:DNA-binding IclR family transcriptional regulator
MRGVTRMLGVLDCFTESRPSLTLQEIANRMRLPKSTAFRIVGSLAEAGYLIRLANQEYCLSFKFVRLAGLVKSTLDIRQIARPVMEDAARRSNETVTLNTVSGRERVCIDVVDTPSPLMSVAKPGEHVRLAEGSASRVLIAHMPRAEQRGAVAYAAKALGCPRAVLEADLDRIRRQGFAITHGERVAGLTAVSVPVRSLENDVRYCVSITGPSARMQPVIDTYVTLAVDAGRAISLRLGAVA